MIIPAILGPTASGKSSFALDLCAVLQGEIVSCDSRQVYEGMQIGTAGPSEAELKRIPHHLVGFLSPAVEYSAVQWARAAADAIGEILQRGKVPVICGGTFFYYSVLVHGLFESRGQDYGFRTAALKREAAEPGSLFRELEVLDSTAAGAIHPNDTYRVIRALQKNRFPADREREHRTFAPPHWDFQPLVMQRRRDELYRRINSRVDDMMERGLYEEFQSLYRNGFTGDTPGMKCVGYKEFFNYIQGGCTRQEAVAVIQRNSRRYAKRQLTWLRNKLRPAMILSPQEEPSADMISRAVDFLRAAQGGDYE
ncbi:MAG: tRNA (adenosine(37)-N6)-dimethylallyltransferase MiaA [Fibrobacterota bacterium]